jgi:Na+-transporting NADH:ubiquinone oxidoreductase subunit NqrE
MSEQPEAPLDMLVIQEMQLLLAEKRTALSTLRTGIAIFAFPLSVLSVLIATSKNYELHAVLHWLLPMLAINCGLIGLAVFLIVRGLRKLSHYDSLIAEYKRKHAQLSRLLA